MITKTTLDRVLNLHSPVAPILSVYLDTHPNSPHGPAKLRLKNLIKQAKEATPVEDLEHDAKSSFRQDLEKLEALEEQLVTPQAPGYAIFACSALDVLEVLPLPRRVRDRIVVDSDAYVRPMLAILDEYRRYCAVVLDRRQAAIYEFYMGELLDTEIRISEGVRKKNFAGYYGLKEHNVRNHAEEVAHRHYRAVAAALFDRFKAHHYDLLLIGGHEETNEEFQQFLHPYVRERVAGTFTIDPSTMTMGELKEACARLEREFEEAEERQLVQQLLDGAVHERRAVLGIQRTLDAANAAAIGTLLIQDGVTRPGAICDNCGHLALEATACPNCQTPMREVPDVLDELAEDTINEGGSVEHIRSETQLKEHGVGAMIRFPVPVLSQASS
ncbi:MAG: peptide chain release factor 1 [Pirellulaceae bacterium]|nr:MAG: peptide chain release factor 1 [Pirellulaceae bacterium]